MDRVKTYRQVNRKNEKQSFGIGKIEDHYKNRGGVTDDPHRHHFFTIIFIKKATGKHIIDFNAYSLATNQVYFISPGQVHQIHETSEPEGYGMVFTYDFLAENNIPISFVENLNLFNDFGESPPLALNKAAYQKVFSYLDEIYLTHKSDLVFKYETIGALLKLILIQCNHSCTLPKDTLSKNGRLLRRFKSLINTHYKEWHAAKKYAEQLNITPDHLNRVVKAQTGKTAKAHIQSRIIVEAKRLIYFTELSNKEIGYDLGFSMPSNFSAFFKHYVDVSLSEFKSST